MKSSTAVFRLATVLAAGLTLATACAAAPPEAPQTTSATEAWPDPDRGVESIESLRHAAAVGDADAALAVATRLVDRFERGGASADLFEATIWIDRYQGNETFANSGLVTRVQQKECAQKVLRHHWICDKSE